MLRVFFNYLYTCSKQKESIHSCLYFLFISIILQNFNIFCFDHHISLCFRIANWFHLSRTDQKNTIYIVRICRFGKENVPDSILPRLQQKPGRFLVNFLAFCLKGHWETCSSRFHGSGKHIIWTAALWLGMLRPPGYGADNCYKIRAPTSTKVSSSESHRWTDLDAM